MDEYFLSKDEWDTLVELGVGSYKDELVLKKVATATKTSFTKKYVAVIYSLCRQQRSSLPDITRETTRCHSTKARIWARSPRSSSENRPQTLRRHTT
jgi:hypothetical protein